MAEQVARQIKCWAKNWLNIEHAQGLIVLGKKERVKIIHVAMDETFVIEVYKYVQPKAEIL